MRFDLEAESGAQLQHAGIGFQNFALDLPQALGTRQIHQHIHQFVADALMLPMIVHHQREFAGCSIRIHGITRHAQFDVLAILFGHHQQCHFPVVVDLGQAHQHAGREFLHGIHIAEILGFRGQAAHEFLRHFRIFRANRTDGDIGAVGQLPLRDQMRRIRMNRHVAVAVGCRRTRPNDDACIGGKGAVFIDQQRIDVEFFQPGQRADHFGNAQQNFLQRLHVRGRAVAELAEQLVDAGTLDQIVSQIVVQRRQRDGAILHRFDIDAAGAEHDHRPQHRVGRDADQYFARVRAADHRLDHDAIQLGIGLMFPDLGHHAHERTAHGLAAGQTEADAADIGFMADLLRIDLHDHRETHLLRHQHRFRRIARDQRLRDRNMEGGQQGLRFDFGQRMTPLRQRAFDNQAGAFDIRLGLLRQ